MLLRVGLSSYLEPKLMIFTRPAFALALLLIGSLFPMTPTAAAGRVSTTFSVTVQVAASCGAGSCIDGGFTIRPLSAARTAAAGARAAIVSSDPEIHVLPLPPTGGMASGYRIVSPGDRAIDLVF
jgi:hypothetical protein